MYAAYGKHTPMVVLCGHTTFNQNSFLNNLEWEMQLRIEGTIYALWIFSALVCFVMRCEGGFSMDHCL
jgi:hypothetical protein